MRFRMESKCATHMAVFLLYKNYVREMIVSKLINFNCLQLDALIKYTVLFI